MMSITIVAKSKASKKMEISLMVLAEASAWVIIGS